MSHQSITGKRKRSPDEDEDEEELSEGTSFQGQGTKKRRTKTDPQYPEERRTALLDQLNLYKELYDRLLEQSAEDKKTLAEDKKTLAEDKKTLVEDKKTWRKLLEQLAEDKRILAEDKKTWERLLEEEKKKNALLQQQLEAAEQRARRADSSARLREKNAAIVDGLNCELHSLKERKMASSSTQNLLKQAYFRCRPKIVRQLPLPPDTRSEAERKAEESYGQAVINKWAGELAKRREEVKEGEALKEEVLQEIFSYMLASLLEDCNGRKFEDYHARASITGGSKPDGLVLVNSKEKETLRSIVMNFEFKRGIDRSFTLDDKAQTIQVASLVLEKSPLARSVCSVLMNERYMVLFRVTEDGTTAETEPLDCRWAWKITEGEEGGAEAVLVKEARKELVSLMHRPLEDLGHHTVAGSEEFGQLLGKGGSGRVYKAVGGRCVYKIFDGGGKDDDRAEELRALESIAKLKNELCFLREEVMMMGDELRRLGQPGSRQAETLSQSLTQLCRQRDILESGLASLPVLQECALEDAVKMNYAGERVDDFKTTLKPWLKRWLCQAVDALEVVHKSVRRVHGDVRPPNLLVADAGKEQMRMTLVDFAFSTQIGATPRVKPHDFTYQCNTSHAAPRDDLVSLVLVYIFLKNPVQQLPVDWQPLLEERFKDLHSMAIKQDYDGLRQAWGGGGLEGETGLP